MVGHRACPVGISVYVPLALPTIWYLNTVFNNPELSEMLEVSVVGSSYTWAASVMTGYLVPTISGEVP